MDYSDYDWYYDLTNPPPRLSEKEVYERLAVRIANELFDNLMFDMIDYAKKTPNKFFHDNSTIWEQMKYDTSQGDPFWHIDFLEDHCCKLIKNMSESEVCLLWFFKTYSDNYPEDADMPSEIANAVMDALYPEAEAEYKEDEECKESEEREYEESLLDEDYDDEEKLTAPPGIDNSPEERKRLEDELKKLLSESYTK